MSQCPVCGASTEEYVYPQEADVMGFLYPAVDALRCTSCGWDNMAPSLGTYALISRIRANRRAGRDILA